MLEGMRFHAAHGVHTEEELTGHWFVVDVYVELPNGQQDIKDQLARTLDYEILYGICASVMAVRVHLLETLAEKILTGIRTIAEDCGKISVTVAKEHPPFGGYCQRVAIQMTDDPLKL